MQLSHGAYKSGHEKLLVKVMLMDIKSASARLVYNKHKINGKKTQNLDGFGNF